MNIKRDKKSKSWVVYILRCADYSLYTGITNNVEKRFMAHNQGKGAKYTRSRLPVALMAVSRKMEQSAAMRLEFNIKRLPPSKKISGLKEHAVKKSKATPPVIGKEILSLQEKKIQRITRLWKIRLNKIHDDIIIQGSPERSVFRIVIEDEQGRYFVVEQIPPQSVERKKQIAASLDFLAGQNLAHVHPYLADDNGDHIRRYRNLFWQMTPFVHGVELNREKYVYEKWRGPALAKFLIDLRRKSGNLPRLHSQNVFSLKGYIYKLIGEINLYNRNIKVRVREVAEFLEKDFMRAYEKIPIAFCHGDYHPLNIIWSSRGIKSVIDWEFCGRKSEIYDVANLIGCVGVEDPQSLTGELVKSFISDMREAGSISRISWKYLLEYIVALRFAWLAEWLRKKDTDMIALELDYMRLLIDNKKSLQKAWL